MTRSAKIGIVLGVAAVLGILALIQNLLGGKNEVQRGWHLANVDWLPPEANDVTFTRKEGFGWFTCYECKISKEALDRMALTKEWKLELKSHVPIDFFIRELAPSPVQTNVEPNGVVTVDLSGEPNLPTVKKALYYENRASNGGGITVVYDIDTMRLFVYESHR